MPNQGKRDRNLEGTSTLREFAASARFDGNVRSETSGGVSAVQRNQRLRAPENSHSPCKIKISIQIVKRKKNNYEKKKLRKRIKTSHHT